MKDLILTYTGKVENGQVFGPRTKQRFRAEVGRAFEGKRIEITVQRKKKRRSPEQNRYYWGLVLNILSHQFKEWNPDLEITTDIVHEWCKERFLPMISDWEDVKIKTPEGEKEIRKTTTRMTTVQFMDYIALIQQFAAEYGFYIPDPDEWEFESVEAIDIDAH